MIKYEKKNYDKKIEMNLTMGPSEFENPTYINKNHRVYLFKNLK